MIKIALLWLLMAAAVLIDLWDGVHTSKKIGEKLQSRLLRKTVEKIVDYSRLMGIAAIIDAALNMIPAYKQPYVSMAITVGLVAIELKSMMEHASRRRSATADISQIIKAIIRASTGKDAQNVLNMINEFKKLEKTDK